MVTSRDSDKIFSQRMSILSAAASIVYVKTDGMQQYELKCLTKRHWNCSGCMLDAKVFIDELNNNGYIHF